ncbi:MAG: phage holin family protein [Dermatophilus congolensis]|nr:phage holin family protein [Dermatophilus congolensis]
MSTHVPPPQASAASRFSESTRQPAAPRPTDPSIGRLVNNALEDVSSLVRNEIALAKAEIAVDVKRGGIGAAMFAVAGVFAFLGLIFLLHTFALGIFALGLPLWASYLIVTLVLFIGAVIVALIGKSKLSKVNPKPERTIATTKDTIDSLKRSTSGEATAAVRRVDGARSGATSTD